MIDGAYTDFFEGVVAASGALTGLLFVALSIAPSHAAAHTPEVIRQVRSAAALLAFVNPLAVALFGLVPNTNVGYPAAALGVIGIAFTAAGLRSILTVPETRGWRGRQLGLLAALLAIFGAELVCGIVFVAGSRSSTTIDVICYCLAASLMIGIARAWELVGDRDTGLSASLAVLTGRRQESRKTD
ncbi:MAG: hypothetical protein ABW046_10790 [Actinoplanes sp.]